MDTFNVTSIIALLVLIIFVFLMNAQLKLGVSKKLLEALVRMILQLSVVGFFLEYLFEYNKWYINLLYLLIMTVVSAYTAIKDSNLNLKLFIVPVFNAMVLSDVLTVLYFNAFVVNLSNIFDASHLIAIGGMILGNSVRANITGLSLYYDNIRDQRNMYQYRLAEGATHYEALLPFVQYAIRAAVNPTIASMATLGIVSLPGMMTGQILAGQAPFTAIKYQIAIWIAILFSTVLSMILILLFTSKKSFDSYDNLQATVFEKKSKKKK